MLKVGLIGAGHLGKIHLKCWQQVKDVQVAGFYDIDANTREIVSHEFGIKSYEDVDQLMSEVDALDIVTPTTTHYYYAEKAIKKGKHLFIEKPVTSTLEEAQKLLQLSEEAGVIVQVGHVERFNPAFLTAKPYIQAPMFIETHRLALFNPRGMDVSVILDLMIHDLDIVLHLVKSPVKRIHAVGVAVVSDTPDIANARIEFAGGCVANLTTSRISLKNMRKTRIFQKNAYISIDFLEKKCDVVTMMPLDKDQDDPLAMVLDLGPKGKRKIVNHMPDVKMINAIEEELRSFTESILHGKPVVVPLTDGFEALELAYRIKDIMAFTTADQADW